MCSFLTLWKLCVLASKVCCYSSSPNSTVQSAANRYSSTWNALASILRQEGFRFALLIFLHIFQDVLRFNFRSLYSGCSLGVIGATIAWASYMYIYNEMKQSFVKHYPEYESGQKLSDSHIAIASLTGGRSVFFSVLMTGLITQVVTTPIWLVKTRLQLNKFNDPTALKNSTVYRGPRGILLIFFHYLMN